MDFRKRALDVLSGKTPDRIPWFADLSWWVHAEKMKETLDKKYAGSEGFVNLHTELHTGLYLPLVWAYAVKIDCPSDVEKDNTREIYCYHTPHGTLTEVHRLMPESYTWSYEERLIKGADDLRAFRYFIEAHQFKPAIEEANHLDQLYGEQGLPVVWVPRTPLSRFIVEFAGIETTVFAAYEQPDTLHQIFELMEERDDEPYRAAASTTCDLVMIADNLSSEIQSPPLFREYSLEYYGRRVSQLHEAKKFVLAHIDGTLRGLLPLLAESGLDSAEGVTPAPVGDVEPDDLRSLCGERMRIWGGIPGVLFSPTHSKDELRQYVDRYLQIARNDGRMILGVGDQVPPGSDLGRVRLVSDMCEAMPPGG